MRNKHPHQTGEVGALNKFKPTSNMFCWPYKGGAFFILFDIYVTPLTLFTEVFGKMIANGV